MVEPFARTTHCSRRLLSWLAFGLPVFVSAFVWAPSRDGLEIVYALALYFPMLAVLLTRRPNWAAYGGLPTALALAYASWAVLSSLWGEPAALPNLLFQWSVLAVWLCGVSWLHQARPVDFERLYHLLVVLGAVVALSVVLVFYWRQPLAERLVSWTVARNPVVVGQVFGVVAVLALTLSWQATTPKMARWYFLCLLCALAVLGLTQSRGPLLAFVLTAAVAWWWLRPHRSRWVPQGVAVLAIGLGLAFGTDLGAQLWERGLSFSLRESIWWHVVGQILERPWWGIGLAGDTYITIDGVGVFHHAHNAWLDSFYRTGAVGLVLVLGHLALVARGWARYHTLRPLYLWLVFGLLCLLSDGRLLFWELDAKWFLYWIPTGLIAAALAAQSPARRPDGSL